MAVAHSVAVGAIIKSTELHRWVDQMRKEIPHVDVVCNVAERMRKADGEDHRILADLLLHLFYEGEEYDEALQLLNELIKRYPDDVRPPTSKASLYLYHLDDAEEALRCIDLALDRARRTGLFHRRALGYKARILLELGRGQQLSEVLEEIMSLRIRKGVSDIGRERDFIDRAPPGLIRDDVLARYNQFRPRRPGDTTANEPPKYESADYWARR